MHSGLKHEDFCLVAKSMRNIAKGVIHHGYLQ